MAEPGVPTTQIGVIGLGLVGRALAHRLARAGMSVIGYDRDDAAQRSFSPGRLALSAADLSREASIVVLAVFDTAGAVAVVEGVEGLLQGGTPQAIVDCSTGDPDALAALAARLQKRGIDFIEAPLSGSSAQIAAGEATMLLGGESHAIASQQRLLEALSPRRFHVGGAGMGAKAKLATNLVLGLNRAALAEGIVFAEGLGIAPEAFLALVLATPARSAAAETKGALMVSGRFEPQSRIRQHLKDVDLMLQQAGASGQKLPLSQAHAALMRAAIDAGDGELDNAAIIRQVRRERTRAAPPN